MTETVTIFHDSNKSLNIMLCNFIVLFSIPKRK